jgi:hypothetical protein
LAFSPVKFSVSISVVPGAPTDAVDVGYKLMQIIGASPGWNAIVNVIDAEYSPRQSGLRIAVRVHTDPLKNQKATTLKSIFDKAGIETTYADDHQMPEGQAKVVVGFRP